MDIFNPQYAKLGANPLRSTHFINPAYFAQMGLHGWGKANLSKSCVIYGCVPTITTDQVSITEGVVWFSEVNEFVWCDAQTASNTGYDGCSLTYSYSGNINPLTDRSGNPVNGVNRKRAILNKSVSLENTSTIVYPLNGYTVYDSMSKKQQAAIHSEFIQTDPFNSGVPEFLGAPPYQLVVDQMGNFTHIHGVIALKTLNVDADHYFNSGTMQLLALRPKYRTEGFLFLHAMMYVRCDGSSWAAIRNSLPLIIGVDGKITTYGMGADENGVFVVDSTIIW